jgi:predicted neutral ceramidase superfamily lipid hydrolase
VPHCSLSEGPAGRACLPSNKAMPFPEIGNIGKRSTFVSCVCLPAVRQFTWYVVGLSSRTQVHSRASSCEILVGLSGLFFSFLGFLPVLRFSPVSNISLMLHSLLCLYTILIRTLKKRCSFGRKSIVIYRPNYVNIVFC